MCRNTTTHNNKSTIIYITSVHLLKLRGAIIYYNHTTTVFITTVLLLLCRITSFHTKQLKIF